MRVHELKPVEPALTGEAAVLALYPHWAALNGLATAILRDRHAGQDAVQDALVGVLTNGAVFADEAAALRYARTAVLNQCRSALRRHGTAKRHLFSLGAAATVAAPPADHELMLNEAQRRVIALLHDLPVRQREVLGLRYLYHLDDGEVAAVLEIGVSTVRSTASRALAALHRSLESGAHPKENR